ncbi:M12 family metallo-peptidase [Vibrio parahaemolyticus]|uniref:M12 family metallo-peptidase n=1 Tax=Vibrio parahaemolyticus TaxID=670 RepID=UPI001EEA2333|nr:M12 family metallo-peptidase [Vibrio parahaemolyticus]MCG6461493.1 M12 family metallo-peptidase [Vibrio parahaemolyticus]
MSSTVKSIGKLTLLSFAITSSSAFAIEAPECKRSTPLISKVHFFASEEILNVRTKDEIKATVETWFTFSNLTMQNSCIPLKRELEAITYLKGVNAEFMSSLGTAKYAIESETGKETQELFSKGELGYVGALIDSSNALQNCGEADMGKNFFIVALNCATFTMEHELGHLAGAGHDVQTVLVAHGSIDSARYSTFPKSKEYAFGWRCANSGTVMSYALGQNLPIYSSPDIFVKGQRCGDSRYGNNAQVMRDFVKKIVEKQSHQ